MSKVKKEPEKLLSGLRLNLEIRDSKINGKGIFAKILIRKGEVVLAWSTKVLTYEQASQLPEGERGHYTYPEGDYVLWMQPPERARAMSIILASPILTFLREAMSPCVIFIQVRRSLLIT